MGDGTFGSVAGPGVWLDWGGGANGIDSVASLNGKLLYGYRQKGVCYVGTPSGTPLPCDVFNRVNSVDWEDVNGDGTPDAVFTVNSPNPGIIASGSIGVAYGLAAGGFLPAVSFRGDAGNLGQVIVGDWNGDGKEDFAVANDSTNVVSVLLANANGSYHAVRYTGAGSPPMVAVGDFNKDGILDTASAGTGPPPKLIGRPSSLLVRRTVRSSLVHSSLSDRRRVESQRRI